MVSGPPDLVTEVYWALLGSGKVVALSELLLPVGITSAGQFLTLSAGKAFLLSDVWTPAILVLCSTRIGDLPAQISGMVKVLSA